MKKYSVAYEYFSKKKICTKSNFFLMVQQRNEKDKEILNHF